ncbi:MAG: NADH-quinone oxidoreductase subunit F [Deltaproteobacteria bacterium]|nr:NADH-quinone oxidoreductase subunit F [Deltaproteobacteria bacterium]
MKRKTAIVIGATGLGGKQLTILLSDHERYEHVKVFVRRSVGFQHPKLEEHIVDFGQIETWKDRITGDELFSAMGTTIKKAGSKEAQYKVDFTYQYETAKAASENGVEKYLLVSSPGADHKSRYFYLRVKGELEEKVENLPFKRIVFFRPSVLVGERSERRLSEELAAMLTKVFTRMPFSRKYRPIDGKTVAQAMVNSTERASDEKIEAYVMDQIFDIARSTGIPPAACNGR